MRRRRQLKRKLQRLITRLVYILGVSVFLWFAISWGEVITHSLDEYHDYWDSNMFVLMTNHLVEE